MSRKKNPNDPEWKKLPTTLLSRAGKKLVSGDPNLSEATMCILATTEEGLTTDKPFFFDADHDGSDIGMTCIAGLILERPGASMAELTALYAAAHRTSFFETAVALCRLRDTNRLYTVDVGGEDKAFVLWHPTDVPVSAKKSIRPPAKRRCYTPSGTASCPPRVTQ